MGIVEVRLLSHAASKVRSIAGFHHLLQQNLASS